MSLSRGNFTPSSEELLEDSWRSHRPCHLEVQLVREHADVPRCCFDLDGFWPVTNWDISSETRLKHITVAGVKSKNAFALAWQHVGLALVEEIVGNRLHTRRLVLDA